MTAGRRAAPAPGLAPFLVLWGSQTASTVCSALTLFTATVWLAERAYPRPAERAQLSWALTAASLASYLPALLVAPLAGSWADRRDRRRTMIGTNAAGAALATALALLLGAGALTVSRLIAILTGFGIVSALHYAAFEASYMTLVPRRHLARANALMSASWSLSSLVGPGLASFLISLPNRVPALARLGDGSLFAVTLDAASFVAAAACLGALRIPSPPASGRPRPWHDVRAGIAFIVARPALLHLVALVTFVNLVLAMLPVVQPLLVKLNLSADGQARGLGLTAALALVGSAMGAGGLLGMLAMTAWGGLRQRRARGVLVPMALLGLALFVVGVSRRLYLTAAAECAAGALVPVILAHAQTIWQRATPSELQGRVFSMRRMLALLLRPLGVAACGAVAGSFGAGLALALPALVLSGLCALQGFNRALLTADGDS